MTIFGRIRLLPVLIIVAALSFAIRAGEFATGLQQTGTAVAQENVEAEAPPLPDTSPNQMAAADAAAAGDGAVEADDAKETETENLTDWQDAGEAEFSYSPVQRELYEDLADRRQELKEWESRLKRQEALLEATERQLDQKMRELTAVRDEIETLLEKQKNQEQDRVQSLVKIYEGMKAKDAARIFNTLDLDILVAVMSRMSERKSAPILAEMNPDRARNVTIMLAQEKQLPSLPQR